MANAFEGVPSQIPSCQAFTLLYRLCDAPAPAVEPPAGLIKRYKRWNDRKQLHEM